MLLTKEIFERNRALFIFAVTALARSRPWQESFIDKLREEFLSRIVTPFIDRFSELALGSLSLSQSSCTGNRLVDIIASQTKLNPPGTFVSKLFVTRSSTDDVRSEFVVDPLLHAPTHQRPLDESGEGHPCRHEATDVRRLTVAPTS